MKRRAAPRAGLHPGRRQVQHPRPDGESHLELDRLMTAEEVGTKLGLRAREVRRLFEHVTIRFGKKLTRFHPADIARELERYRGGAS